MNLNDLVEPDRVHRRVYTDPAIFEPEMANILERPATHDHGAGP